MKYLVVIASLCLAACAAAPPPKAAAQADLMSRDTAGIVGIEIGHRIAAFIFFSNHGKVRSVGADECAKADGCTAMVQKFGAADKTILLHFEPSKPDEGEAGDTMAPGLPHRPLHEIDVQGHQPAGSVESPCGDRVPMYVPETGEFLMCLPVSRISR